MKHRSHALAVLALLFFSLPAAAQVRSSRTGPADAPSYGSFQRTQLLTKARKRGSEDALRLGAADRRSLLTTGKSIIKPVRRTRR
jgi:hypothetical protein